MQIWDSKCSRCQEWQSYEAHRSESQICNFLNRQWEWIYFFNMLGFLLFNSESRAHSGV
jgi:hypothetical protein